MHHFFLDIKSSMQIVSIDLLSKYGLDLNANVTPAISYEDFFYLFGWLFFSQIFAVLRTAGELGGYFFNSSVSLPSAS